MLEFEIKKLTDAIEALTVELKSARVGNQLATETPAEKSYCEDDAAREEMQRKRDASTAKKETSKKVVKPVLDHEPVHDLKSSPPAPSPDITADDLKTVAMELARADSSARPAIIQILADHNAKTITQLDPKQYNSVHGALLKLAKSIYNNSEAV
jgi:hypothetical protein